MHADFDDLATTLAAASPYIRAYDKAMDVFSSLRVRECELLYKYNKNLANNSIEFVDDVRVVNSPKNRFLMAWGMSEDIDAGMADDPCGHLFDE